MLRRVLRHATATAAVVIMTRAITTTIVPHAASAAATSAPRDSVAVPARWRTYAESTAFRRTPNYAHTLAYCRRLAAASPWLEVTTFGHSLQGRDLPLVIVSRERAFTPAAARATGKAIVLVQCGIHAGEIEGKDACLALIRDVAVLHARANLLDHAILLVVPILSVDAHERVSPYNRINQDGPAEMGWRFSPVGLNLNRDYVKAETSEIHALLANVFTRWWPHLLIDTHTTDGSDWQYDVTYALNHGAGVPEAIDRWGREAFDGRVVTRLESEGHVTAPYVRFRGGSDPASGVFYDNSSPKFSHGYPPLQNRAAILVETHSLKPYEVRVRATYDLLVAVLDDIRTHPQELTRAVADAEADWLARMKSGDPARRTVVLDTDTTSDAAPFRFRGWRTTWEKSDITNALVARYTHEPWDTLITLRRETRPTITVLAPRGYLVPQEWTTCHEHLDVHGVRYRRFTRAWTDTAEFERVTSWRSDALFEGHDPTRVSAYRIERMPHTWRPGDLWVPTEQPAGRVAVELFEAQAPDGLTHWNAFDTVLLRKEYAEAYVMEPIARRMLADDAALRDTFQRRLATDTTFAKDSGARLDFFYNRSKWADPEFDLLPVARALHVPPEPVLAPASKVAAAQGAAAAGTSTHSGRVR